MFCPLKFQAVYYTYASIRTAQNAFTAVCCHSCVRREGSLQLPLLRSSPGHNQFHTILARQTESYSETLHNCFFCILTDLDPFFSMAQTPCGAFIATDQRLRLPVQSETHLYSDNSVSVNLILIQYERKLMQIIDTFRPFRIENNNVIGAGDLERISGPVKLDTAWPKPVYYRYDVSSEFKAVLLWR